MADQRTTTFAGQVQTEFLDSFEANPLPITPLKSMARDLPNVDGANTFREYIVAYQAGTVTDLTTWRAKTTLNPLSSDPTIGGQVPSQARPNKYMDHTIDTVYYDGFDIEATSGIDAKFNSPEAVAARNRVEFDKSIMQFEHEECAAQALNSNQWIVPAAATISLAAAVTATDTTFDISDAEKASSGIAVGDIVKIGNVRSPNATDGVVEYMDIALVKTIGADGSAGGTDSTITIETDTTKFPDSLTLDGRIFKNALVTALTAHADEATVQVDRPTALTTNNIDSVIASFRTKAARAYVSANDFVLYMAPEVYEIIVGSSTGGVRTPIVANDYLGKGVLTTGEFMQYRGMTLMTDANAISRAEKNSTADFDTTRHYIWAFERGMTYGYGKLLKSSSMDKIPGTAGLLHKFSYAEISGSVMLYNGSIKSFLMPVTV